jgi:hypothetical protein
MRLAVRFLMIHPERRNLGLSVTCCLRTRTEAVWVCLFLDLLRLLRQLEPVGGFHIDR